MKLNDKLIRKFLLERLGKGHTFAVYEELRLIHNRAIADVVTLGKSLHCYEIKGETDTLVRLKNQIPHYNQVFEKISIVITERNLQEIRKTIPDFWGILLASKHDERIRFTYIRRAKRNPECNSRDILLSLWKPELAKILNISDPEYLKKCNRKDLISQVVEKIPDKKSINLAFSKQIILRKELKESFLS